MEYGSIIMMYVNPMHICTGTGKSVTGAHIAYALAMRLCKEQPPKTDEKMCVMYCGPSQQSVNVVLGKLHLLQ